VKKQIIRQLQKSGNGYSLRVPREVREDLQANKQGDNVSFGRNPDSGKWELDKVDQPNPGDGTPQNIETESRVDNETQSQQPEPKFKFCAKCSSENIDITGNKYYCHQCDVLYEFTAEGIIPIELGPLSEEYKYLKSQLENNESKIDELDENFHQLVGELNDQLGNGNNNNGNENENDSEPKEKTGFLKSVVETVTLGLVGVHYVEDEDEDQ